MIPAGQDRAPAFGQVRVVTVVRTGYALSSATRSQRRAADCAVDGVGDADGFADPVDRTPQPETFLI